MNEIKNRSAYHEFFIDARYDAGMVLQGTEVKSIRGGKVSFNDAYCLIHKGEIWVKSLHIAEYSHGNLNNHEPMRDRKLLLQKKEIKTGLSDGIQIEVKDGLSGNEKIKTPTLSAAPLGEK